MSATDPGLQWPVTIGPGAHGPAVRRVQEWLVLRAALDDVPSSLDGVYGTVTADAVRAMQAQYHMPQTGVVDAETFHILAAQLAAVLGPYTIAPGMSFRDVVLMVVARHIASHPREVGGPNSGPWVLFYTGHQGAPWAWCAAMVAKVIRKACALTGTPEPRWLSARVREMGKRAGSSLIREANARGTVKPGDIFLLRGAKGGWHHTGFVTSVGDVIGTAEGNTNDDGSAEGKEAIARTRPWKGLDFISLTP